MAKGGKWGVKKKPRERTKQDVVRDTKDAKNERGDYGNYGKRPRSKK